MNKFHNGNGSDGKHYWLTPPDLGFEAHKKRLPKLLQVIMKRQWTKIGEVTRAAGFFQPGLFARYAVMESISENGMRNYKEVFMYSWSERCNVIQFNPQPQDNG